MEPCCKSGRRKSLPGVQIAVRDAVKWGGQGQPPVQGLFTRPNRLIPQLEHGQQAGYPDPDRRRHGFDLTIALTDHSLPIHR